jgi:hypothetical protein
MKNNFMGKCFQNIVTNNIYCCVEYKNKILTLEGIGKVKTTFNIPLHLAFLKYKEVERG